jgi:hypothetical protein
MMKRILFILACTFLLVGCDRKVDRDFFSAITLGTPEWTNGMCFLPATLPTKITHSGQWIYKVDSKVEAQQILLTAHLTSSVRTAYFGKVNLGSLTPGEYEVLYLNPNGKRHSIGKIKTGLPTKVSSVPD